MTRYRQQMCNFNFNFMNLKCKQYKMSHSWNMLICKMFSNSFRHATHSPFKTTEGKSQVHRRVRYSHAGFRLLGKIGKNSEEMNLAIVCSLSH